MQHQQLREPRLVTPAERSSAPFPPAERSSAPFPPAERSSAPFPPAPLAASLNAAAFATVAAREDDAPALRCLLQLHREEPSWRRAFAAALTVAASNGALRALDALLTDLNPNDGDSRAPWTPLAAAVRHPAAVRRLLAAGADPRYGCPELQEAGEDRPGAPRHPRTPLERAAYVGAPAETVRLLLANGGAADAAGLTDALAFAAEAAGGPAVEPLRALLAAGARPDARALRALADAGYHDLLAEALAAGGAGADGPDPDLLAELHADCEAELEELMGRRAALLAVRRVLVGRMRAGDALAGNALAGDALVGDALADAGRA